MCFSGFNHPPTPTTPTCVPNTNSAPLTDAVATAMAATATAVATATAKAHLKEQPQQQSPHPQQQSPHPQPTGGPVGPQGTSSMGPGLTNHMQRGPAPMGYNPNYMPPGGFGGVR